MIEWNKEWKPLLWIILAFLVFYFLPLGSPRFDHAVIESLELIEDREGLGA